MAIDSSLGCGGAPASLAAPDPASMGVPAVDTETAGSSLFSMMLSGMSEMVVPAAEAPVPAVADAEEPVLADPSLVDPELSPEIVAAQSIVASQAMVAALIPATAAPPVAQLKQSLPADPVSAVSQGTVRSDSAVVDNGALSAAWLAVATKEVAKDPAGDALLEAPADGNSLEQHLALAGQSGSGAAAGSPAAGFSPMLQVSQLGGAFAQFTPGVLQPQPSLQHNVGTARWAEELGSRLTMMASQGQLSGSLSLSPDHLGPLHVQIEIRNDVANVWFGSQHADTRAALNDALPRLREMFGASGLVLGDAGVSRDTPRQEAQAAEVRRFASQREDSPLGGVERRVVQVSHSGILDIYA